MCGVVNAVKPVGRLRRGDKTVVASLKQKCREIAIRGLSLPVIIHCGKRPNQPPHF